MLKQAPYIALAVGLLCLGTLIADSASASFDLSKELWGMLAGFAMGGLGWVMKSPSELRAAKEAKSDGGAP